MQTLWFVLFLCSICLEGLGRKYLPQVPAIAFYFLKDVFLLGGYLYFRPSAQVRRVGRYLYRGFGVVWAGALAWTVIELVNPEQQSFALGLIGLRGYWLWWAIAPFLIAEILQERKQRRNAIYALIVITIGISVLAAFQFAAPPDSALNLYSVVDGEEVYADITMVSATGRARVSSTFSFISGFSDFTILIPTLLLSLGLETQDPKLRRAALFGTVVSAAVVPMSGSRSSIILGVLVLAITAWTAGFLFTRIGRRVVMGAIVTTIVALVAFPDAFAGVESRFADTDETSSRLESGALVLPPVALLVYDYPVLGLGTGMQQNDNARAVFHVHPKYETELDIGRYLIELGPVGYLLVWTSRLGMIVAMLRSYSILKRAGRRGAAGAALSYAALTVNGNITFDHIWQALYFTGCGIILAEVVGVMKVTNPAEVPRPAVTPALALAEPTLALTEVKTP